MTRIGTRHRKIALEANEAGPRSDSGERLDNWRPLGHAFAMVTPLRGRELADSGLRMTERPTRFVFPYSKDWADLKPADRIYLDDVCYDLESVIESGYARHEFEALGVVRA